MIAGLGYMGYVRLLDPTYLLVIIGMVISLVASARVKSTFNKYSSVRSMSGLTGEQAARRILDRAGLTAIGVEHVRGKLSDHYDPRTKTVRLSDSTFGSASVAAVGVAAHECGHALQHNEGYAPLQIRSALVPIANIGSKLGIPIIFLGVILSYNYTMIQIGIWAFAIGILFQIVTLPVEFNASSKALVLLETNGILGSQEVVGSRKVLNAAALTYVAAALASILSLVRLVLIFGGRNDD